MTLLVLDLRPPASGTFAVALLDEWSTYLAHLIAFRTIGSIWLSHHNAFTRIRRADPVVLLLNLVLLLGASLVPWPTALISSALRDGHRDDQIAAVLVYSLVTVLVGVPWVLLSARLARRPHLLDSDADRNWMRRNAWQSSGSIVVAVVASAIAFLAPIASLILYVVVPTAFLIGSVRATATPADAAEADPRPERLRYRQASRRERGRRFATAATTQLERAATPVPPGTGSRAP